ncbi:hypothetical protein INR49_026990, partial [Caranx melampygus]
MLLLLLLMMMMEVEVEEELVLLMVMYIIRSLNHSLQLWAKLIESHASLLLWILDAGESKYNTPIKHRLTTPVPEIRPLFNSQTDMALFENCSVVLELKTLPFKERRRLKSSVTENGGSISFLVNKQCSLIVTNDVSSLSSNKLRNIQKYETPVVGVDYVYSCLDRGVLLPVDEYKLDTSPPSVFCSPTPPPPLPTTRPDPLPCQAPKAARSAAVAECPKVQAKPVASVSLSQRAEPQESSGNVLEKFRVYKETDSDVPLYPESFQVAKYSIFETIKSETWCVLELQSVKGEEGRQYRVVRYWKSNFRAKVVKDMLVFPSNSEEALEVYQALRDKVQAAGLKQRSSIPPQAQDLGSTALQQLLVEERLNTASLSQEVGVFVEMLWTEALGSLRSILTVSFNKLSLNDVTRAEGLLLQAQKKLREDDRIEVVSLLREFYTLLPHRVPQFNTCAKLLSQKLDLCQLIRDLLNVSEMTLRSPAPSCLGKYRALRCSIEAISPSSPEFQAVTALLQDSKVQIQQVLQVSRGVELQTFKSEIGNIKPLLHSSSPGNFVGILSRGLLLPRVGVEHHGIERTDIGNLGSGIYFTDSFSTSLKYSSCSTTDGSRLLLVCDVALGSCKDVHKRDFTLTKAPEGHDSVHGVRRSPNTQSEFEFMKVNIREKCLVSSASKGSSSDYGHTVNVTDDEYVVYSPDQVKLKYVVQFRMEGDPLSEFSPTINTSAEPQPPPSDQAASLDLDEGDEKVKNPLEDVTAGLLDSSGQQLPLQAVHVKCKLMDLLSQVIIFQKYTNTRSVAIEAKYVFPLDDSAAVCGFEAFINGKHVVGKVKEKETARKEYKQAIEKGHGAYLMDQDAPDVFTISVGNLPPGATVLIKVTYVSELMVRDGGILFSLPGSVAPWQESAALNQTTQVTVEKVCVTDESVKLVDDSFHLAASDDLFLSLREFTLDMSIEMPYEISKLQCITHKVKIKRTDCKAVVSVLQGEVMGAEGFQLSITLSEVHLPRMWVEKHPDKDSQACMLVFYPDFDVNSGSADDEVVLLLDTSESMRGESLHMAQRVALQVLRALGHSLRVNVISFGTDHTEAFLTAQPLTEARQAAEKFIKHPSPIGGSTELWRPLRALSLLPPSRGTRNLLLLSDGHIQNAELTLQLLRDNAQHSRLFTCGLSPTANRHMLRALAQAGGGAYEFFDTKTKHNWAEKVARQVKRIASPGCSSVSVKWQQFNPTAPTPVQAPKQLHALFNNCHTLVYGFVPHCTQATLLGNLSGQELKTMVSTSELQKTRGTFLHKLTARALIRDYEDGNLDTNEAEHEGKKAELKSFIIDLSKEFSILSQFTSFVAIEERDLEQPEDGFTDIPKLIAEEDVDFLPYVGWTSEEETLDKYDGIHYDSTSDLLQMSYDLCYRSSSSDSLPDHVGSIPLCSEGVLENDSYIMAECDKDFSPVPDRSPKMKHYSARQRAAALSLHPAPQLVGLTFSQPPPPPGEGMTFQFSQPTCLALGAAPNSYHPDMPSVPPPLKASGFQQDFRSASFLRKPAPPPPPMGFGLSVSSRLGAESTPFSYGCDVKAYRSAEAMTSAVERTAVRERRVNTKSSFPQVSSPHVGQAPAAPPLMGFSPAAPSQMGLSTAAPPPMDFSTGARPLKHFSGAALPPMDFSTGARPLTGFSPAALPLMDFSATALLPMDFSTAAPPLMGFSPAAPSQMGFSTAAPPPMDFSTGARPLTRFSPAALPPRGFSTAAPPPMEDLTLSGTAGGLYDGPVTSSNAALTMDASSSIVYDAERSVRTAKSCAMVRREDKEKSISDSVGWAGAALIGSRYDETQAKKLKSAYILDDADS